MSLTFGFDFEELGDSPSERVTIDDGVSAVRRFKVPWQYRWAFAGGLLMSQYPGFFAVRCDSISIDPFIDDVTGTVTDLENHLPAYDAALIVASYSGTKTATREDRADGTYITYQQNQTAEFFTVPSRALFWEDNSEQLPPDANAAILIPRGEHVITWHDVESPNWAVLSNLRGRVNDSTYNIPAIGLQAPEETLLYMGSRTSAKVSTSGQTQWEVSITLSEKKISSYTGSVYGWNHTYRDKPAGWVRAVNDSGDPSFQTADLGSLFNQA